MGLISGYKSEFRGEGTRRGRECEVAEIVRSAPSAVKKARENSLSVKGARLFNLLPAEVRNITSDKVHHFKTKLDEFLKDIPDEPDLPRAAESNCLLHQIPMFRVRQTQNLRLEFSEQELASSMLKFAIKYQVSSMTKTLEQIQAAQVALIKCCRKGFLI